MFDLEKVRFNLERLLKTRREMEMQGMDTFFITLQISKLYDFENELLAQEFKRG